jgi:hypothetical protein
LGAAGVPSGIAWILSGNERTKSLRAANSCDESPFTCEYRVPIYQMYDYVINFEQFYATNVTNCTWTINQPIEIITHAPNRI